ncbi:MAG: tripartite tricarboxylate transporter substrate binding protein, partial [Proteobacteria bacterium]|nr:tripartite tricarboxylate transporter substrate binding protein [Burkholderiales bacterium]
RPVRLVVPFAPGGGTDIVARLLAPPLGEVLGQSVIVDNRAGAAGNIAMEIVARAQPDGYTVLVSNVSTASINPILYAGTLKFDPVKELAGVTLLAAIPNLLVSGAGFPPTSFKEVIAYARARPGQMNYSTPLGGYSHLDMLDLAARTGMQLVNVPSKGAGSSAASIINGEIHFSIANAASTTAQVKAGRMKAFATTATKRLPDLPDVPTFTELGFAGVGSDNWNGLFVPAKTPRATVNRLHQATVGVLTRPAIQEGYAKVSVPVAVSRSPEEFDAFVRTELARWGRIIKENQIRLD